MSDDGRLAYGHTTPHIGGGDVGAVFPSQIEVRESLQSAPVVWTSQEGTYLPITWAGRALIVEHIGADAATTLWAYTNPDTRRSLGPGWLVAISPDGTDALISHGMPDGPPAPGLRIVNVTTGQTVGRLDLRTSAPTTDWQASAPTGTGAWSGDSILIPASSALETITFRASSLSLEQVRTLGGSPAIAGALYKQVRFGPAGANSVVVLAKLVPTSLDSA